MRNSKGRSSTVTVTKQPVSTLEPSPAPTDTFSTKPVGWNDYSYERSLVDQREKWAVGLTLSAIGAVSYALFEKPHIRLADFLPLTLALWGSAFVYAVNCRHSEKRAKQTAETKKIRYMGWMHIVTPLVVGMLAFIVLFASNLGGKWVK